MNTLIKTIILLASMNSAFGQSPVIDYIDLIEHCEHLKSVNGSSSSQKKIICKTPTNELYKAELFLNVEVNRVREDKDKKIKTEKLMTELSESELAKICKDLESSKSVGEDGSVSAIKSTEVIVAEKANKKIKRKWRISFTFGPFLSYHKNMSMRLVNSDTDVVIDGLEPVQRTGHHHYAFWSGETRPGQFIDEPQNDMTVEIANGKTFFGLRYSHPKTLFQDRHDNPQINHNIDIKGTIGGVEVDETGVDLKNYIHTLTTSHGNTNINVFGGRIFNLAGKPGKNNLELRLGVGAGVSFANGVSKYWAEDEDGSNRRLKITEYAGMKVYGFNLTGESALRYNFMNGKMNASINGRGVYTRIDGQVGDFKATGNLYSGQVGVSLGYSPNLIKTKKERAERKIAAMKKRDEKLDELESELEELRSNE